MRYGEYEGQDSGVLTMKIFNANIPTAKEIILELIAKIDKVERTPREIDAWLILNLGTDIFGAWVAIENDEPVGVLTCEVVEQETDPKVFISFCYCEPNLKANCCKKLLTKCEEWAKAANVKKLMFYTKRSYRTFEKKYGFKLQKSILEKEL